MIAARVCGNLGHLCLRIPLIPRHSLRQIDALTTIACAAEAEWYAVSRSVKS